MNFLRTSLAAALAVAAVPASALPLTHAFNLRLDVSGATAQEASLVLAMVDICDQTDLDVWFQGNHQVVTCTINAAGAPLNGQTVIMRKSGVGGSGNGIGPVFQQTGVPFATDAAWGTCTTTTATTRTVSSGTKTFNTRSGCTITTAARVPGAGLSDVEPRLFANEFGAAAVTPGTGDRVIGTSALAFGVVATTTLRNAMQAVQGLTVGSDDVAQMPSISTAELASVLTGNLGLANQLAGAPAVVAAGGAIDLARRVNTSGSQKIAEVALLNQGCASGVSLMQDTAGLNGFGGTVSLGSGTSDLLNALRDANLAGRAGIGFVSTESAPNVNVKYLKIDGFAPSIEHVINGNYRFFSMNAATLDGSVTGDRAALFDALTARLSASPTIQASNAAFNRVSWQGGFVGGFPALLAGGLPDARPVSLTVARGNPVFAASKDTFGAGSLNNCDSTQLAQ